MTETQIHPDPKQQALLALSMATEVFFRATLTEIEKKFPGRAAQNLDMIAKGQAHIAISIQADNKRISAALALVTPVWTEALADYELRISGSISAALADPATVTIVNRDKMN